MTGQRYAVEDSDGEGSGEPTARDSDAGGVPVTCPIEKRVPLLSSPTQNYVADGRLFSIGREAAVADTAKIGTAKISIIGTRPTS